LSHRRTWLRRLLLAAAPALFAVLMLAPSASAHSFLLVSDPPDGSLLAKPPSHVVLVFSSGVVSNFTSIDLVEASGKHYQPRSIVIDKSVPVVSVNLPELPNGSYRLSFSTRDQLDLHQTSGSVAFGVGISAPPPRSVPAPAPAKPSEYLLRWVSLTGLAGMMGGLLLALLIVPRLPESGARNRVQATLIGLSLAGIVVQLLSGTALLVVQAVDLGGGLATTLPRLLTGTDYGALWVSSTLLGLVTAVFVALLWRRAGRGAVPGLVAELRRYGALAVFTVEARVLLLAIALAGAAAISGHAANAAGLSSMEVLVRTVHLTAMAVWAGGVVALTIAVVVLRRSGDGSASSTWRLVGGFGPYAAVSFAGLGISGLLLSGSQVASWTALFSTPYGTVLIAKVLAAGVVALIALRHALISLRGLWTGKEPARLPRGLVATMGLEAGGAIALVLLASVLGASSPARGPQFDPPSTTPVTTLVTQERNTLVTSVSMKPNREGPNLVSVNVIDARRPALAPIESVTVRLARAGGIATTLATTKSGNRYDAGTVTMPTGDVAVSVVIRRSGLTDTVVEMPWRVNPPEVRRAKTVVSSAPLAPLVNLVAALIGLLAIAMGAVVGLRGRRWLGPPPGPGSLREPGRRVPAFWTARHT
jgi:copper transport protein